MAVHDEKDRVLILELKRKELAYDIQNLGYIIRDSMKRESPEEGRNISDIMEDGNADRIQRILDLAYAEVMRVLSPYVDHRVEADAYGNDILNEPTSYYVFVTLKHTMPGTTENLLRVYVHEFMVAFTMADWLAVVAPRAGGRMGRQGAGSGGEHKGMHVGTEDDNSDKAVTMAVRDRCPCFNH